MPDLRDRLRAAAPLPAAPADAHAVRRRAAELRRRRLATAAVAGIGVAAVAVVVRFPATTRLDLTAPPSRAPAADVVPPDRDPEPDGATATGCTNEPTDVGALQPARTPEQALRSHAGPGATTIYTATVFRNRIEFSRPDGDRVRVRPRRSGWAVVAVSRGCPNLPPGGVSQSQQLTCPGGGGRSVIYNRTYEEPSLLSAVHAELRRNAKLPAGGYRPVGRERGNRLFGHTDRTGVTGLVSVRSTPDGFGAETASWCPPGR